MLLVELQSPRVVLELGTHYGVSYCAFCQAVAESKAGASCYAVDAWARDAHTGPYSGDVKSASQAVRVFLTTVVHDV